MGNVVEHVDRQVAAEIAVRAAARLEVLAAERPDLLAERLAGWESEEVRALLELTRLPDQLAEREVPRRHVGVQGIDHRTESLVTGEDAADHQRRRGLHYADARITELDDDDLLAARHYIPETLPGNVLG
jgi:hypothetical protein